MVFLEKSGSPPQDSDQHVESSHHSRKLSGRNGSRGINPVQIMVVVRDLVTGLCESALD
jgi:hypothetical protein